MEKSRGIDEENGEKDQKELGVMVIKRRHRFGLIFSLFSLMVLLFVIFTYKQVLQVLILVLQKQKLAIANQLNLRSRQIEVWFQNRRARTKLKQNEADCEYLKRCCETLSEENMTRLHKELQDLRALKTPNSDPFFMSTTLTMCPSCERQRLASTPENGKLITNIDSTTNQNPTPFPLSTPRFYPWRN